MGHPNPQNLKVPTSEQARINGAKGGKASAEAKKRKKTMMELMDAMLTKENEDPKVAKKLEGMGFDDSDNIHMANIITSVMKKAENGDLKAVEMIVKLLYGDSQNINVNLEGEMNTMQRVQIYLPERDPDPE